MAGFMNQLAANPEQAGQGKGDTAATVENAQAKAIQKAASLYAREHQEDLVKIRGKDKVWAKDLEKWRQRSASQVSASHVW